MINKIVHFSDLHIRLYKDHELFKNILSEAFREWNELKPDRIVFTGDLVHSKNQMLAQPQPFVDQFQAAYEIVQKQPELCRDT